MSPSGHTMADSRPIRILTVDDHALLREGIAALIAAEVDMTVVGAAATGREAVEQFRALRPDVTLMDLQMPDLSGLDALTVIRAEFPAARIIVLTTYSGDAQMVRALKAGASGYLLKDFVYKELPEAIRAVHAGRKILSPEVSFEMAAYTNREALTSRQPRLENVERIEERAARSFISRLLARESRPVDAVVHVLVDELREFFVVRLDLRGEEIDREHSAELVIEHAADIVLGIVHDAPRFLVP